MFSIIHMKVEIIFIIGPHSQSSFIMHHKTAMLQINWIVMIQTLESKCDFIVSSVKHIVFTHNRHFKTPPTRNTMPSPTFPWTGFFSSSSPWTGAATGCFNKNRLLSNGWTLGGPRLSRKALHSSSSSPAPYSSPPSSSLSPGSPLSARHKSNSNPNPNQKTAEITNTPSSQKDHTLDNEER